MSEFEHFRDDLMHIVEPPKRCNVIQLIMVAAFVDAVLIAAVVWAVIA